MIENSSSVPDMAQQVAQLAAELDQRLNQRLKGLNLTAGNYFYLLKIAANPGIMQREFSEVVHVNPSTITRAVNHLIDQGLVDKKSHPRDGRATRLFLTSMGEKIAEQVQVVVDEVNQQLLTTTAPALPGYEQVAVLRTQVAAL
ncbi:MarR family winged helix-turn-helix transcriptional regulator [Furfurilactobacillus siliginis]|uniref:Transcriptional regulator n=1 Tax=Furfurilactobacillus siliginis TaxID=348151 RepID=A0A0R2L5D3_9LACO|nr:MarR family transcriptional regulator [Furfurilactobacillus siliginis]KRN96968.1 hypothetical protein IV55_GL000843 [Furfurilactobacillus siliginis]GEK27727.1 transcriptional regulator [Furfurilactobacillus siliginis]